MPKGKRKQAGEIEQEKSTIIGMRDGYDWGRVLYDACAMFNLNLAEYWIDYAAKQDGGGFDDSKEKADMIESARDEILARRERHKQESRRMTRGAFDAYNEYSSIPIVGDVVREMRASRMRGEAVPQGYADARSRRDSLKSEYLSFVREKDAEDRRFGEYMDGVPCQTRELGNQFRNLMKLSEVHKTPLARPISEDLIPMYEFIVSEDQVERLMSLCISILNNYSQKEFCTMMCLGDRERVAENIYDRFSKCVHNYDFLAGCYERHDDGLLHLRPFEVLSSKFYNGYYMTIRGYVQRAYVSARDEKFMVSSLDASVSGSEDDRDISETVPSSEDGQTMQYSAPNLGGFDEGMVAFWNDCKSYLHDKSGHISGEILRMMRERFPCMEFYSRPDAEMPGFVDKVLDGIDEELSLRRSVGAKLKQIVLDAMDGAETQEEWQYCTFATAHIIYSTMLEHFTEGMDEGRKMAMEDKFENRKRFLHKFNPQSR